jgi:hypothetical protein
MTHDQKLVAGLEGIFLRFNKEGGEGRGDVQIETSVLLRRLQPGKSVILCAIVLWKHTISNLYH